LRLNKVYFKEKNWLNFTKNVMNTAVKYKKLFK